MRNRFEILSSLESIFLRIQNKIVKINPGSVLYSLFYSFSSELEAVYDELDNLKTNSYIATASGEYLDNLIFGFSKLERIKGRRALGYVVLEVIDTVIDSTAKIENIKFSFPFYDIKTRNLTVYPGNNVVAIATKLGTFEYYILPPISLLKDLNSAEYYELNPTTNRQYIADYLVSSIKQKFLQSGQRYFKYLVLPIVSFDIGEDKNLDISEINTVISFGNLKFKITNNYDYFIDLNNDLLVDIDGAGNFDGNTFLLKENSFISGGSNQESDDSYRSRFYLYLNSLTRGTFSAIEEKLKEVLGDIKFKLYQTSYPGVINLYIDTNKPISSAFTSVISTGLSEVKPAGTQINILLPKNVYINVLSDLYLPNKLDASSLSIIKSSVYKDVSSIVEIGKNLTISDVEQSLLKLKDSQIINNYENLYIGYTTTNELFSVYKKNYFNLLRHIFYKKDSPYSTFSSNNPFLAYLRNLYNDNTLSEEVLFDRFSYNDFLNILKNGYIGLYFLDFGSSYVSFINSSFSVSSNPPYELFLNRYAPRFDLKNFVEKIKTGEATLTSETNPTRPLESLLNTAIVGFCKNIDSEACLRRLALQLSNTSAVSNGTFLERLKYYIQDDYTNNSRVIAISLKDIKDFSEILYDYYLIKLMTLPIPSDNDIELCDQFGLTQYCTNNDPVSPYEFKVYYSFLNDIKYYKLMDVDNLFINANEIVRIYSSSLIEYLNTKFFVGVNSAL